MWYHIWIHVEDHVTTTDRPVCHRTLTVLQGKDHVINVRIMRRRWLFLSPIHSIHGVILHIDPLRFQIQWIKMKWKKKTLKLYSAESIIIQYKNRYFNNVLKHMTNCLFINFTIHFFLQRHPSPMNRSCHLLVWTVLIFQWHYDFLHGRRIPIHTTTCPIHMTPIWWQPNHDLHLIPGTWIIRHITTPGCQWRKYTKERRDRVVIITKFLCDDLLLILEVWIFSAMT